MNAEVRVRGPARRSILARHPWVFRDRVEGDGGAPGTVVRVLDPHGALLGHAAWSPASRIALRMLDFGDAAAPPGDAEFAERFRAAAARRRPVFARSDAVRLCSSEADGLPGLVVDLYADVAVVQSTTPFAERLLPRLVEWLSAATPAAGAPAVARVLAKHDLGVRDLEGLPREVRWLHGTAVASVEVREGDLRLEVDLEGGQKSGLFLDQRANRLALAGLVPAGAAVLDVFCYAGGFALHAARHASQVLAVDDSARALARAAANADRNGLRHVEFERGNAFHVLRRLVREGRRFEVVVLDPPAFAKSRRDVETAVRGYREINAQALRLVAPGGRLVSASCSHHVDEPLFEEVLRRAAADAGRDAVVHARGTQDEDHPVLLGLPESRYLKCFFLDVR